MDVNSRSEIPNMALTIRSVSFLMPLVRYSTLPEDSGDGCCVICGTYLDLHQPQEDSPDRLLGVCVRCGRWYVIVMTPESDDAIMAVLPGGDAMLKAHGDGSLGESATIVEDPFKSYEIFVM